MMFDESTLYYVKSDIGGIRRTLFDLASWKNGLAFKKIDFSEKGRPVIKIAELNNGISANTSFTEGDYGEGVYIRWDDLLFSWSGNPQTSIDVFRYRLQDGWLNQHIFKVTANEELITKDFLYYVLKFLKPRFTQIATNKQTTGLGHVTIADLKRISLIIPSKDKQDLIVSILKALDDKIELNNRINENLEQQADALYQAFFSPNSGTQGKIVTLDEFCSIFTGKKNANASVEGGKYKFFTCAPDALQIDSYIYDGNAIIVSGNGAYTGRTRFYSGRFDLYQRTYACTLHDAVNPDYIFPLYWFVKLELSKKIMGGTRGSAIPYIVMNDLAKFEYIYNEKSIEFYMPVFKSLTESIQANEFENERLAQMRDILLPKLLSGQLDVSEIDL